MAKKVEGYIKLQIPAGKATPAPPVGPALGQHGVNIVQFTKEFNARTADKGDLIIPVVITVYQDRTFSFITKTPPAAVLLKKYCNDFYHYSISLFKYIPLLRKFKIKVHNSHHLLELKLYLKILFL